MLNNLHQYTNKYTFKKCMQSPKEAVKNPTCYPFGIVISLLEGLSSSMKVSSLELQAKCSSAELVSSSSSRLAEEVVPLEAKCISGE